MTNNTVLYWEANGLSLHTYAWSIETKGGSHHAKPGKRGDDFPLPFHDGHERQEKSRDAIFRALPMWVAGVNQDGTKDNTMSEEAKLQLNWDLLMSAMNVSGQFPLVKRFYAPDGVTVQAATGLAEMLDPPEPQVAARDTWRFAAVLKMADPYFYGSQVTASVGTFTVTGTERTSHVKVEMGAGRVTFPDGNWIEYSGAGTATVDCRAGTAKVGSTFVNGLLERNKLFPNWPHLNPGSNTLTGSGTVKYDPAYS